MSKTYKTLSPSRLARPNLIFVAICRVQKMVSGRMVRTRSVAELKTALLSAINSTEKSFHSYLLGHIQCQFEHLVTNICLARPQDPRDCGHCHTGWRWWCRWRGLQWVVRRRGNIDPSVWTWCCRKVGTWGWWMKRGQVCCTWLLNFYISLFRYSKRVGCSLPSGSDTKINSIDVVLCSLVR